jgi:hypothetical protein
VVRVSYQFHRNIIDMVLKFLFNSNIIVECVNVFFVSMDYDGDYLFISLHRGFESHGGY